MSDPITRLEGELAKVGSEHEPPPGRQARVLAATAAPPKRRWWMFAIPAVAVAVVALVIGLRGPDKPELVVSIESQGAIVRGTTAKVGELVRAKWSGSAVWICREDALVIACPGNCETTLRVPGRYTVVAIDGKAPPPTGSLDADVSAAHAAGATSRTETIEVR